MTAFSAGPAADPVARPVAGPAASAPLAAVPSGGTVVVLRALGLGDLLTAVPALRALARAFPDADRVLFAPAALTPLVALLDRAVTAVADTDFRKGVGRLRRGACDLAVNLHGRGPDSHRALLAGGPVRLLAFRHPDVPASAHGPEWRAGEHEVVRWCRLLEWYGIAADPGDLRLGLRPGQAARRLATGATLIHPGAASPARRWPVDRWAVVARAEAAAGRRVLITGGPGEEQLASRLAAAAGLGPASVLAGRTSLTELAQVVAAAARVLSADTGLAHLATAVGTPSVVVFGPTPPTEWGPPPDGPHVALWAGRRGDPHAAAPDPGLLDVGVEDVLEALERLETAAATTPGGRSAAPGGGSRGGAGRPASELTGDGAEP